MYKLSRNEIDILLLAVGNFIADYSSGWIDGVGKEYILRLREKSRENLVEIVDKLLHNESLSREYTIIDHTKD